MIAWLLACASEPPAPEAATGTCTLEDSTELVVVRKLWFEIGDDAGVSEGFDLDGAVTEEGGATGCGIGDYVSPAGVAGVDNAFTRLVPTLESTEAKIETIEGLIQSAIDSGELLVAFELGGVDDWGDDDCVALRAGQASGEAMIGTDGLLLDGQTFDHDTGAPAEMADDGAIVDGTFEARGLSVDIPAQILNASLNLPLRDGAVRVARSGDDLYEGVFAGGVATTYLEQIANTEDVDPVVAELLGTVLDLNADLPDADGGACASLSITFGFEGVGAYWY